MAVRCMLCSVPSLYLQDSCKVRFEVSWSNLPIFCLFSQIFQFTSGDRAYCGRYKDERDR